ncbi:MAG: DUF1501 domain-containing protein [Bryobacteraceae bacterium]
MTDRLGHQPYWSRPQIGRRMFFRHVTSAVGGYFLLPGRPMETVARAAVPTKNTAKNCIFLLLTGAPSHADTFDLKEGAWTPARFNPTSYGDIRFPQGLMPKLADQLNSIALLRSVRAWAGVHGLMQTWVQIGRNPTSPSAKISPHIGSVASIELTAPSNDVRLPAFLALNGTPAAGSGYLPPQHSPFIVTAGAGLANTVNPAGPQAFERRSALLQDLDAEMRASAAIGPGAAEMAAWNARARMLMYNPAVNAIFTLAGDERQRFGNSNFGNACLTARNLLRANMGTRFIQINFGSWDHHANIYAANAGLTPMARQFDDGLSNLLTDLRNDGLLDQTLIVAQGEFGRTVGPLNANQGRDHFLQQTVLFAGGGVRGGAVIGATDEIGSRTIDPGWSRGRDVRNEDIEATIYSALGIDWTTIRRDDPLGRGFEYVPGADRDLYGPVNELWG